MRLRKYFKAYRNGVYVGDTEFASIREARKFVRDGKVMIGTHMGQWVRTIRGYRYETTVGVTVDFVRFAKPLPKSA